MSFDISVDVSGLERMSKTLNFIDIGINGDLTMEDLVIVAERILELAQQTVAFRTGALRASLYIKVDPTQKKVAVGTDIGYGKFVELGTTRMSARPFLFPALLQALNEFKQRFPERLKEMSRIHV